MTPANLRRWRLVHRWTSLICSVNLLILCITGLILVFHHEIEHLLGDEFDTSYAEGQARLPLQSLADIARKADPAFVPKLISFDPEEPAANYIYVSAPGDRGFDNGRWVVLNGYSGANEVMKPPEDTLTGFLLKLHVDLFAGFAGQMFVGVMGVLFVASTISGLVVYGPFMKKLAFGLLRFRRGTRIANIDLHNLFGDTDSVHVELDENGGYRLTNPIKGDTVADVLRYVQFDAKKLIASYQKQLTKIDVTTEQQSLLLEELKSGVYGYTYFED